jgi:hypothetical protein
MVQRLDSPRLITDSMGSGGTPHESFGMSAPGSPGIEPAPQAFEVPDLAAVAIPAGKDATIPNQPERDGMGRFSASEPDQTGGWTQVKGLSR